MEICLSISEKIEFLYFSSGNEKYVLLLFLPRVVVEKLHQLSMESAMLCIEFFQSCLPSWALSLWSASS